MGKKNRSSMNKFPKWMHHRIFRIIADCIENNSTTTSSLVVSRVLATKPIGEFAKKACVNQQFGMQTVSFLLTRWGMKNLNRGLSKTAEWKPKLSMSRLYDLYEEHMGFHPIDYLIREPDFDKSWQ